MDWQSSTTVKASPLGQTHAMFFLYRAKAGGYHELSPKISCVAAVAISATGYTEQQFVEAILLFSAHWTLKQTHVVSEP